MRNLRPTWHLFFAWAEHIGAGTETFHAWLPKIITFSTYVFGEGKKKSIFAVENHLCLFN